KVEFRVIRARHPCRTAARLPTLARPAILSRLALVRNRPQTPCALAGLGIVGVQKPANTGFAPADARDDLIPQRKRRNRDAMAGLVIGHFRVPAHRSRL